MSEHHLGALKVLVRLETNLTSVSDTSECSGSQSCTTDEVLMTVSCMFVQICVNLCINLHRVYQILKYCLRQIKRLNFCVRYVMLLVRIVDRV